MHNRRLPVARLRSCHKSHTETSRYHATDTSPFCSG